MKFIYTFLAIIILTTAANSQTWVQKLNGRSVWSLTKDDQGNIYAGGLTGANSRIWRSSNGGDSWDTIYAGAGNTMWAIDFDDNGNIFVANYSDGLLISTNGGANFTVLSTTAFNGEKPQGVACGSNGYVFVTTSMGFFRSTNSGTNFTQTGLTGLNVLPVLVDKDSSNIVYAGVSSGTGVGIGFYRSTDNGATFSSNLNSGKNGYSLFQNSDGSLYLVTTTSPYNVDKSTNKGLTWATLGNALSATRGVTLDLAGNIYLTGNGGAYRSTNGGSTFTNFNLTGSSTPVLTFQNKILVGSISGSIGVNIFTDSTISGIDPGSMLPTRFSLDQNYPNPFNPETNIKFSLPVSSDVMIILYDISGREVKTLLNEYKNPGIYEININADGLSSGVYFYKMITKGFSEIRKMVLMK
ncbi:MAG: T9SS type A sorting domain-containing protein [Ignavibacteriae bacterium]|nr:T9SS type A sorting domain-containing protein [Ignavibacteriota bacterium]